MVNATIISIPKTTFFFIYAKLVFHWSFIEKIQIVINFGHENGCFIVYDFYTFFRFLSSNLQPEFNFVFRIGKIAHNVDGLLLCWHFIMSSRQLKLIEIIMLKITRNAEKNSAGRIIADSTQMTIVIPSRQHSSKPLVVRSLFYSFGKSQCVQIIPCGFMFQ
jgi:hypothetical protein